MTNSAQSKTDPFSILQAPAHLSPYPDHITSEEKDTVSALQARFYQSREARRSFENSWEYNRLYLRGEQLIVQDRTSTQVLRVVTAENKRQRYSVDNILRPTARAFVGKNLRAMPGITVVPATEDRTAILAAEVQESYLDNFSRAESLKLKYKRAQEYLPWCGTAIMQLSWNHRKGRRLYWCKQCDFVNEYASAGESCMYCEQTGQPPSTYMEIREGAQHVTLHDTRDFFPEPGAIEIDDMQWCIIQRYLPVAAVRRDYPDKAHLVQEQRGLYKDRSVTYTGTLLSARIQTNFLYDYTTVYEYHERESAEWPDGRMIIMANDRVLSEIGNPYVPLFGRLPFFTLRADRNPREFWGEPPADQAVTIQKDRNKLLTQMRSICDMTLNPKLLVAYRSGIAMSQIDESGGQMIKYNSAFPRPAWLEVGNLPPWAREELIAKEQSIRSKFGVTDQEAGITQGDPSGRYAALLESQSTESIAPMFVENHAEYALLHKCALVQAQNFESPEKRWTKTGRDRIRSYKWWDANIAELGDVVLAEEDSLAKNPALRLQQAVMLLDKGVFTNQQTKLVDMKTFMRVAQLKLPGTGPDIEGTERAYAAQVPDMIMNGQQVQPVLWDDAKIMAEELMGWLRGPGRTASPELVSAVANIWLQYAMTLQPGTYEASMYGPAQGLQQPGQQQAPQPGQGDGQASPAGTSPAQMPLPMGQTPDTQQLIQQYDQQGEQAARAAQSHEG